MAYLGREAAKAPIVTADLPNDGVTLAKMTGGTDGQIITYDASGDPVAVGPGTDGQVLTSTGAGSPPAFEDAGGSTSASDLDTGTLSTARMAAGTVIKVFRNKDTTSGDLVNASTTPTITQTAFEFDATSGRHYIISGSQFMAPYRLSLSFDDRVQNCWLYYGTTDGRVKGGTTVDDILSFTQLGRYLIAADNADAASYHSWSYNASFTAASTEPHFVYTVISSNRSEINSRSFNNATYPHYVFILEVLP